MSDPSTSPTAPHPAVVRAPGYDEPLPAVDDRIVAPGARFEVFDGQVVECAPAEEPHGRAHSNVDFVIRAHARPSFAVAVDMLTRANRFSDIAPDISVFPEARDPDTGGRQVEHIAIEVRDTQALSDMTAKARLLHARGVRRVLCLDLPKSRVIEWNAAQDEWAELPLSSNFVDRVCFVKGIQVHALLDAALAENAAAAALLSKKNPVIANAVEQSLEEGVERGLAQGREQGREQGIEQGIERGREQGRAEGESLALRQAISDMCSLLGIDLDPVRRSHLDAAQLPELRSLRAALLSTRRWPAS